jgi:hypothetical protein
VEIPHESMIFACDIVQPAPALTLQSGLKILADGV